MTLYTVCLVLHVVGVAGLFTALGIEGGGLFCLGRASTNHEVRGALAAIGLNRLVGPPSILATLVSGFYMTRTWGWTPWIDTSLGLMAVVVVVGAAVTGRRTARLERDVGEAVELHRPIRDRTLTASFLARTALLVATLLLMVTKLDLPGSLAVAGAGALSGALLFARSRTRRPA
jgi:hypothetical protein